jgi:hypothetical protein
MNSLLGITGKHAGGWASNTKANAINQKSNCLSQTQRSVFFKIEFYNKFVVLYLIQKEIAIFFFVDQIFAEVLIGILKTHFIKFFFGKTTTCGGWQRKCIGFHDV